MCPTTGPDVRLMHTNIISLFSLYPCKKRKAVHDTGDCVPMSDQQYVFILTTNEQISVYCGIGCLGTKLWV